MSLESDRKGEKRYRTGGSKLHDAVGGADGSGQMTRAGGCALGRRVSDSETQYEEQRTLRAVKREMQD